MMSKEVLLTVEEVEAMAGGDSHAPFISGILDVTPPHDMTYEKFSSS